MMSLKNEIVQQRPFSSPEEEALLNLMRTADELQRAVQHKTRAWGVTSTQYNVLRILRGVRPEGHARCEIARRMVDRASDITRLVDRLQTRGLVKRYRGDSDQREAITCITAKGIKLLDKMRPEVDARTAVILHKLNDQDCLELSRLCALIFEPEPEIQPNTLAT
jgi:DNA-binding MarR family transcriptional regulator